VEDDFLQADAMSRELGALGIDIVGPVGSVESALEWVSANEPVEGAILDVNLGGEWCYPVATALQERDIPLVFWTGYDGLCIPRPMDANPVVLKPGSASDLLAALFAPPITSDDVVFASVYIDRDGDYMIVLGRHDHDAGIDAPVWLGSTLLSRSAWGRMLRLVLRDGVLYRIPPRYRVTLRTQLDFLG